MQVVPDITSITSTVPLTLGANAASPESTYAQHKVIRRNGAVVGFEPAKISIAMTKAFIAVNGGTGAASARVREQVARLTDGVVGALLRRQPGGGTFHIEDIQDQVELALMRAGEHNVARAYVLYREERAKERARERQGDQAKRARVGAERDRERRCEAARPRAGGGARARGVRRAGPRGERRNPYCRRCSATSTTACRWRKCASRWSSPRGR